ncbi:helix-turn-helix domain-containing protein [Virgibacillus halodenitrificans]|uniref:helix-turn-helix domain-containing protein n=1 Tax=Virgibacillus halodenitrificans TaxID=1482 RepID=UPI0002FDDE68|nr:helix-turn-helix domain-containing protein [Virgibacillus halodenitrificans]MEC2160914.1 DUF4115 domain-containing protein [Virgibacillus halodenitrificans]MYL45393.1 DUF4115 domain-containing protein [Virgibacillus halodenitrificans]MYL58520.1 DUF4115 domain-containing protein [Virgibacillus halodenitrificans]
MEVGSRLKEAREAKGLSLDSLQETTKIQKRYLKAIEDGNLHILPGKFYARAFIKEYANAVGIDPAELLQEYKEEIPKTENDEEVQYSRIQRTRKDNNQDKNSKVFSVIPTIIVVLLIIGIFFVAWFLIKQSMEDSNSTSPQTQDENEIIINNPEDNKQDNKDNDEQKNEDESKEGEGDQSKDQQEQEKAKQPELRLDEEASSGTKSTFNLLNATDEVIVTLEASGETWLDVNDEKNESLYSGMLTSEDTPMELEASKAEQLYFNIGNASALTININGVELNYPVDPNENVVQKIWVNLQEQSE